MIAEATELAPRRLVPTALPEEDILSLVCDRQNGPHPCAPERRLLLGILEQAIRDWSKVVLEDDEREELQVWFACEPLDMRFGGFGFILDELYGDAEHLAPAFRAALLLGIKLPYRKEAS